MAKTGRPSKYTPELADEVCRRIAVDPITTVFADPKMPSRQTFYNWLLEHADFFDVSARARAIAAFRRLDKAEQDLDEADGETNIALLREKLQHARWTISKLWPRHYGDKVAHEVTGPGGRPLIDRVEVVLVDGRDGAE
jgi:hypothetical protein